MKTLDQNKAECEAANSARSMFTPYVFQPQATGFSCPDCGKMLMTNGISYGMSPSKYGAQCDCGTKVSICSFSGRWERV